MKFVYLSLLLLFCGCNILGDSEVGDGFFSDSNEGGSGGPINCPTGYVLVPGNGTLGTNDFCVMKFEARDVSSLPASNSSGTPWVSISAADALTKCKSVTESGFDGTFTLISNPEWMTIARNLENTAANWKSGTVGSDHIYCGHSDAVPAGILTISDDSDIYDQTGNHSGQSGNSWAQARVHTLSNGNQLWDFSGNAEEWVDWDTNISTFTLGPTNETPAYHELYAAHAGSLAVDDYRSDDAGLTFGGNSIGSMYGGSTGGTTRGSNYSETGKGGIYSIKLALNPANPSTNVGFRCVYRP